MENSWKEYFRFTKRERTGILTLLLLIVIIAALPHVFQTRAHTTPEEMARYHKLAADLNPKEKPEMATASEKDTAAAGERGFNESAYHLFRFDPNTLDESGWKKLGVREKTIGTISRYLAKGGRFRKPEDIGKIYGLDRKMAAMLIPYVSIYKEEKILATGEAGPDHSIVKSRPPALPASVNINNSDTSDWIALPGIGPTLARRIILFREKLGGFYSTHQVAETYGLSDTVYQLIRPRLIQDQVAIKRLNINTATVEELRQHPYLKWKLANAIVQYRNLHGSYTSTEQLSKLELFTPEVLTKLLPYLSVEGEGK